MSKSTPTPWIDGPYGEIWVGIHRNADGKWDEEAPAAPDIPSGAVIVASAKNPADRALIVKAVNSHAALVEALQRARQFIQNGIELGFIRMPDPDTPDPAHETLPAIYAALAQTERPDA